jgi:hypothetical protein
MQIPGTPLIQEPAVGIIARIALGLAAGLLASLPISGRPDLRLDGAGSPLP